MQINRRFAIRTLQLLVICSAAAVLLAAVPVSTDKAAVSAVGSVVPAAGTFTGQYENGIPVYRLPPVSITVDRKTEMARIEREERLAAAWQDVQPTNPTTSRVAR